MKNYYDFRKSVNQKLSRILEEKIEKLVENLEDLDDVQDVYYNLKED